MANKGKNQKIEMCRIVDKKKGQKMEMCRIVDKKKDTDTSKASMDDSYNEDYVKDACEEVPVDDTYDDIYDDPYDGLDIDDINSAYESVCKEEEKSAASNGKKVMVTLTPNATNGRAKAVYDYCKQGDVNIEEELMQGCTLTSMVEALIAESSTESSTSQTAPVEATDEKAISDEKEMPKTANNESAVNLPTTVNSNVMGTAQQPHMPPFTQQKNDMVECTAQGYYEIPHTNAAVKILDCIVDVNDNYSQYRLSVLIDGKEMTLTVPVSNFRSGVWLDNIPYFYSRDRTQNKYSKTLYETLSVVVADSEKNMTEIYPMPGWIIHNGCHMYVTPKGVLGHPEEKIQSQYGQNFPQGEVNYNHENFIKRFLGLMDDLTPKSPVATIILVYLIQSCCYELFKKAKFPPKFLLFLCGEMGSMKTSLALATTQIDADNRIDPQLLMKSTMSGLESHFREYKDAVMLVDDLMPVANKTEERNLNSNLELLTRCFGDGTGRTRNTDYQPENIDQYMTSGGAIITGEYIEGIGSGSSLSRIVILEMSKDNVDEVYLTELQKDSSLLLDFLQSFLLMVGNNYDRIVKYIQTTCENIRSAMQGKYSHRRYAEYHAQLECTASLIIRYAYCENAISKEEAENIQKKISNYIEQVLTENSKNLYLKSHTFEWNLCSSILEGINNHLYPVKDFNVPDKETQINTIWEDDESYYMESSMLLKLYNDYNYKNGYRDNKSAPALANILVSINVAATFQEEKEKAPRYNKKFPGHTSVRLMQLSKSKLVENSMSE